LENGRSRALEIRGSGRRYARLTVTPPLKLARGTFKISAYAERVADRARGDKPEKFATSLEPLPTLPTQPLERPAPVRRACV